ncbi:uncharacterized protein LOC119573225 [Penaeus monodon]|uniref:uncharacterized protein LOC119573225 n=1 Tax=Penaeus monodon TaxID=6687 RepID=UPI0018A73AED|nr:uncharacterized protein LOC119573225 [Penaeus monodon]
MNWTVFCVLLGIGCFCHARDEAKERFIVTRSTRTDFSLATTTTTVPYSCISGNLPPIACRRAAMKYISNPGSGLTLASSMYPGTDAKTEPDRQPRAAVTVWSTVFSTFTVTSTFTNSATTIPVSLLCSTTGTALPPPC